MNDKENSQLECGGDDEFALDVLETLLDEETHDVDTDSLSVASKGCSIKTNPTQKLVANIHNGDTDSSDDEDNRYFENQKYSDCGRQLKKLINNNENSSSYADRKSPFMEKQSSWKTKITSPPPAKLSKPVEKVDVYTDPVFGIRMINPLITSKQLQERMVGRKAVPMASIKCHIANGGSESDWVIAGVIIQKSPIRTSQKGSEYCIWKISDLKGDLKTVSVFFFRNSHKNLWKTALGTVVGILNPKVMEDSKDKDEATVAVDNAQKVMILGVSKDYGICRAKKKNGDPCTAFVNKNTCTYCIYHVQQEYKKCSRRSDLQGPNLGRGLNALRNKVLGKNEVFYAGKSFSALPATTNRKQVAKDNLKLLQLNQPKLPSSFFIKNKDTVVSTKEAVRDEAIKLKELSHPKLSLVDVLSKSHPRNHLNVIDKEKLNFLGSTPPAGKQSSGISPSSTSMNKIPQLSKADHIDLSSPVNKIMVNRAKLSALAWVKRNGQINKLDPNDVRKNETSKRKPSDSSPEDRASKVIKMMTMGKQDDQKGDAPKNILPSRFMELLAAKSRHTDLIEASDANAQEEYFNLLEKKEKIEEKMLTTYKVPCKAVRCLKCKYTAFSASDLCKKERHPLKVTEAVKRFFSCKNCGNRTATLELIPLLSCKQCGEGQWEHAPMLKERKNNLQVQPLSIRGGEEKHLGSVVSDGNLNLMVPE